MCCKGNICLTQQLSVLPIRKPGAGNNGPTIDSSGMLRGIPSHIFPYTIIAFGLKVPLPFTLQWKRKGQMLSFYKPGSFLALQSDAMNHSGVKWCLLCWFTWRLESNHTSYCMKKILNGCNPNGILCTQILQMLLHLDEYDLLSFFGGAPILLGSSPEILLTQHVGGLRHCWMIVAGNAFKPTVPYLWIIVSPAAS